jgi:hypothetical protein
MLYDTATVAEALASIATCLGCNPPLRKLWLQSEFTKSSQSLRSNTHFD